MSNRKRKKRVEIDGEEVLSIVNQHLADSIGGQDDEWLTNRIRAYQEYLGKPYGNEESGYSQVVSRTVLETIQWILPGLVEVFHASDSAVEVEPEGPEDEAGARQRTDYANLVYMRDNPGFLTTTSVISDALIERLGVWKTQWVEERRAYERTYERLTSEELIALTADEAMRDGEWIEAVEYEPDEDFDEITWDLTILFDELVGRVDVCSVSPSEFRCDAYMTLTGEGDFCAHDRLMTKGDLVAMGLDPDYVRDLPTEPDPPDSVERDLRSPASGVRTNVAGHWTMEQVRVIEAFIRGDFNEDGAVEWVRAFCIGSEADELAFHEVCDFHPFDPVTPLMIAHQLIGLSMWDLTQDLQRIETDILRLLIDDYFEAVHSSPLVRKGSPAARQLAGGRVPGVPILVDQPDDVTPYRQASHVGDALPLLQSMKDIREHRTGTSPAAHGVNADALQNQTATSVDRVFEATGKRELLMVRMFAEGFKGVIEKILKLQVMHSDKKRTVRLRGEWVEVDPRSWNLQMDVTINAGLGTGNKDRTRAALQGVWEKQTEAMERTPDMVTPTNRYNLLAKIVETSDLGNVENYFTEPGPPQPPGPPPDPRQDPLYVMEIDKEKLRAKTKLAIERAKDDRERDKYESEFMLKDAELATDLFNDMIANMQRPREDPLAEDGGQGGPPSQLPDEGARRPQGAPR